MRVQLTVFVAWAVTACAPQTAWQVAGLDRVGAADRGVLADGMDSIAIAQQVIAAERDFAEQAQRHGQWTAFRATAAPGALLFWPHPMPVERALAGLSDPLQAVRWQPHRVIVSCDNTLAATTGASQTEGGGHGYFTTIWRLQSDGSWRWIADHGGELDVALPAVTTPAVEIAECPGSEGPEVQDAPAPGEARGGSRDNSLLWDFVPGETGGLRVTMWIGPRYAPTILPGAPMSATAR